MTPVFFVSREKEVNMQCQYAFFDKISLARKSKGTKLVSVVKPYNYKLESRVNNPLYMMHIRSL